MKNIRQGENINLEFGVVDKNTNSPVDLSTATDIVATLVSPNGMNVGKKYSLLPAVGNGVLTVDSVVKSKILIAVSGVDTAALAVAVYSLIVKVKMPDGGVGYNLSEYESLNGELTIEVGKLKSDLI